MSLFFFTIFPLFCQSFDGLSLTESAVKEAGKATVIENSTPKSKGFNFPQNPSSQGEHHIEEKAQPHLAFVKELPVNALAEKRGRVKSFLFGKKTEGILPSGISLLTQERVCITDTVNKKIYLLDGNGKILKWTGKSKTQPLRGPVGICAKPGGPVFVSDMDLILQYSDELDFQKVIQPPVGSRITGLAVRDQTLYAVDTQNHRILMLGLTGILKKSFGTRGHGEGSFNFPTHIAVDGHAIYVCDTLNFRVQLFDHEGQFIRTFGSNGDSGGNFSKPKGIGVDSKQRIYVADAMFDNIQLFNFKGEFLHFFGNSGSTNNRFWMPSGVAVDRNDRVWVADTYNGRILVFEIRR